MYKKIIFIVVIIFNFFIPILVNAEVQGADSQIPALNPFCWMKSDCVAARRNFVEGNPTDKELADNGFVSDASTAPCNTGTGEQQWGRCLPAGVTKTEIDFGGKSEFANIGVFIIFMYKWLVTIASIVAVIMIIVAGIQWITSGGNSESITSAKHRIGGAVVGLFIAYLSYFILNTINPNLVNFRVPQVWLVRPLNLMPEFCKDVPNEGRKLELAYVSDVGKETDPLPPLQNLEYTTMKEKDVSCGKGFLVKKGGTSRCFGHYCAPSSNNKNAICVKEDHYTCEEGDLVLKMYLRGGTIGDQLGAAGQSIPIAGAFFSKTLKEDWLTNSVHVRAVCEDQDHVLYLARPPGGPSFGDGHVEWSPRKIKVKVQGNYSYIYLFSDLVSNGNDSLYDMFSCDTDKFKHIKGSKIAQQTQIVGYFIRFETKPDQSWVSSHATRLKAAGVGAAVGWLIPIPGVGPGIGAAGGYLIGWLSEDGPPEPNLNIGYENGHAIFGMYASPALRKEKSQYESLAAIKSLGSYIPVSKLSKGLTLEVPFDINTLANILLYKGSVPHDDDEVYW